MVERKKSKYLKRESIHRHGSDPPLKGQIDPRTKATAPSAGEKSLSTEG